MQLSDLRFEYPEQLVATEPQRPSRVMWVEGQLTPREISLAELIEKIPAGDVLVINNTRVVKRRVFTVDEDMEVLFVNQRSSFEWEVLAPLSRKLDPAAKLLLPDGVEAVVVERGLPQVIRLSRELTDDYFERFGEVPLPPYIRRLRQQSHTVPQDETWYQTAWAERLGSTAAPTASLHFSAEDIRKLQNRGVVVVPLTLHVGLGTYLPVKVDDLSAHQMHREWVEIPAASWAQIAFARKQGRKIWALGTTVVRSLESAAMGKLISLEDGSFEGETDLFIFGDFKYKVVDRMLTNFHQPESTLLALVACFAGLENTLSAYDWAIKREFKLFSYGDLSVWLP